MPEDYWSSQAATLAERSIGYDEGHTQGRHQGLRQGRSEGYLQGVAEGRQAALNEIQPQLAVANEMVQGMAQILAAAADALLQGDDATKVAFAVKYADRLDKAMAKGLIRTAPHNNPQLAGLSVVMRLVDESRRACLQATESTPTP
jgi:flagellar biosynthesis/type III secretory pathway protein FliH